MKRLPAAVSAIITVLALALVGLALSAPAADAATPHAANGKLVKQRLHAAIKHLPGAKETPKGYVRDKFKHWVDANGDCQDTRSEVLRQETRKKVTGACAVKTGKWRSYYDGAVFNRASKLDIDHLVPLSEAWKSGAKKWGAARRTAYANDLADGRTLVAVSAHSNRSKGDRDPSEWMPTHAKCAYVKQWVAVKIRWRLKVNPAERKALLHRQQKCGNPVIRVRRAVVKGGGSAGGGLDPRFEYCTDAKAHGYGPYYQGKDPEYYWYTDSDSDGIVCE